MVFLKWSCSDVISGFLCDLCCLQNTSLGAGSIRAFFSVQKKGRENLKISDQDGSSGGEADTAQICHAGGGETSLHQPPCWWPTQAAGLCGMSPFGAAAGSDHGSSCSLSGVSAWGEASRTFALLVLQYF